MLLALLYSLFRLLLDLLLVRCRSEASLQSEILLLRHQLRVLQRQTRRPHWQPGDRLLLAAVSRRLSRPVWASFLVSPETILSWELGQANLRPKLLIHDRDSKFVAGFDEVFRSEGVRVVTTPYRAPRANAVCERWIRSARREALDWLLIAGERHLWRVLSEYVEHYNLARPHRSLGLRAPLGEEDSGRPIGEVACRSRLQGAEHQAAGRSEAGKDSGPAAGAQSKQRAD